MSVNSTNMSFNAANINLANILSEEEFTEELINYANKQSFTERVDLFSAGYLLILNKGSENGWVMFSVVSSYNKGIELLRSENLLKRISSIVLFIGTLLSTVFACGLGAIKMLTINNLSACCHFSRYVAVQKSEVVFSWQCIGKTAGLFWNFIRYVAQGK